MKFFLTYVSHVQDNSASGKEGKMVEYCSQHVVTYCTANSGLFLVYFFQEKATKNPQTCPPSLGLVSAVEV